MDTHNIIAQAIEEDRNQLDLTIAIPTSICDALEQFKSNSCGGGVQQDNELYTRKIIHYTLDLLLANIIAIVPVFLNCSEEDRAKTTKEFEKLYKFAEEQPNWHAYITDGADRIECSEAFTIVITSTNTTVDDEYLETLIQGILAADINYWM